jgi:hypothetical protein
MPRSESTRSRLKALCADDGGYDLNDLVSFAPGLLRCQADEIATLAQNGAALFKPLALLDVLRDLYRGAQWIEDNFGELKN